MPPADLLDPETLAATRALGERAAALVCAFLDTWPRDGEPVPPLSRDGAMTLGAKLILIEWKGAGLDLGDDLVRSGLRGEALCAALLNLYLAHTAWAARPHLDADVRIVAHDRDALLEAVAQLLWDNRPAADPRETP